MIIRRRLLQARFQQSEILLAIPVGTRQILLLLVIRPPPSPHSLLRLEQLHGRLLPPLALLLDPELVVQSREVGVQLASTALITPCFRWCLSDDR